MAATFCSAARRYWFAVYPQVIYEVSHWRHRTQAIPDPLLRRLALQNLETERSDLDGAAAFATFVPRRYRKITVRIQVGFQAIYDYVDSLAEQPHLAATTNAHRLHTALLVALSPGVRHSAYYGLPPQQDDNGYLNALVDTCQNSVATLPAYPAVAAVAQRNANRIIKYQTLINQAAHTNYRPFAQWAASEKTCDLDLRWWEIGAACGSSLVVFALISGAAKPRFQPADALTLENAYFPWTTALHTLLDSLIDRSTDISTGQHSLVGHYGSSDETADRMGFIATEAARESQTVPGSSDHQLLLVAMVSLYLSSHEAARPHARSTRDRVIAALGRLATPTMAVLATHRIMRRTRAPRSPRS
jgi:tetraprenyl-beta-curcumene synthase